MVVAGVVAVIVVDAVKVLVRDAAIINMVALVEMLVIALLTDVEIVMTGVVHIDLKSALSVSYSVDVPSAVAVDLFMVEGVLTAIGIEVLADVNANAFAVVMTALESPV